MKSSRYAFSPRLAAALVAAFVGFATVGCTPGDETPPASSGPAAPSEVITPEPAPPPIDPAAVDLKTGDEIDLAAAVRAHRGSVVLVDFWATWCGPCVKLFPHTVALDRKFGDSGLAVIAVSFDLPEDEAAVRSFLAEKGATFQNLLSTYGVSPKAPDAFEIRNGALPFLKIYDRNGQLWKTFGGGEPFSPGDVDRAVEQILEE